MAGESAAWAQKATGGVQELPDAHHGPSPKPAVHRTHHTAHLPYAVLVSGNKVYALAAKFRIALSFPDLSMMGKGSFMEIMDAPGAIQETLETLAK